MTTDMATGMSTDTTTDTNRSEEAHGRRDAHALLHLCHLVSPGLPIGAYAYSQGLEYAVEVGWVHDEQSALDWLQGLSRHSVGTLDLPILLRLYRAWEADDAAAVREWSEFLIAARETRELRDEERHLGRALALVLATLHVAGAQEWVEATPAFATMFGLAALRWKIPIPDVLNGYLWTWAENQVLAAVRLVPLGQSSGQRLLYRLIASIPDISARALQLDDRSIGVGTVSQAMASALHESQYTRLFRS
jgi:urease accessory protein